MRQSRNKNVRLDTGSDGLRFVRTTPDDEVHVGVKESPQIAFLASSGSSPDDVAETTSTLDAESVKNADWENCLLTLTVETESARPLKVSFTVTAGDDGRINVEQEPLSRRRRLGTLFYSTVNRLQL